MYSILEFKRNNTEDRLIFSNGMLYRDNNNTYHLWYLLSKTQWCHIFKVRRTTDAVDFFIGNRIISNQVRQGFFTINNIKITQDGTIALSDNLGNSIGLMNAVKYVEPAQVNTPPRRVSPAQPIINQTNTTPNNFFSRIQTLIESQVQPIRLSATLKKTVSKLGLHDFLIKFFEEWNNTKTTIFVESGLVQTEVGKRRSLGDIYMICKYYFPEITLKEVIGELYINISPDMPSGFRSSYCNTIHKRVWYFNDTLASEVANKTQLDEFGNDWTAYIRNLV